MRGSIAPTHTAPFSRAFIFFCFNQLSGQIATFREKARTELKPRLNALCVDNFARFDGEVTQVIDRKTVGGL
jgi:hypothetical protein